MYLVVCDAESDVVWEDSDDVDDAHDATDVTTALRRGEQSQQVLPSEQHHTGRVQAKQLDLDTVNTAQAVSRQNNSNCT